MAKRIFAALLMVSCAFVSATSLQAFKEGGALEGKITDKQGFPLPGAFIFVASPSLLGIHNYITSDTGNYSFPDLPPGTYKITVEMPGFKTVVINNMTISVGRTVVISFELKATDIEEEITRGEASPMVDG
ncbi:MAG TPA: carboxypeptidase-like regulatory domain-containing protein, partial [Candidatus Aminicenantes bacterium]|nr:carboxypeptidase-like regulatory domain-containing protein [Candidatus Aminicenantes bacterium]